MTPVAGVHAAVPTPREANGNIDWTAFERLLLFHSGGLVDGVVLNGATGEYPSNTLAEGKAMFTACGAARAGRLPFACGIGAPTMEAAVELGNAAFAAGAHAVLLPAPFFFSYSQTDILEYCRVVKARLPGPVLLYNLPQFTNAYELGTVEQLAAGDAAGIKDSSGSLDLFHALKTSHGDTFRRLLGNDTVLLEALDRGLCHGVVSGIAGVVPELVSYLYRQFHAPRQPLYREAELWFAELLNRLAPFPTPWALKWIAEVRGLGAAHFSQPVSAPRAAEARALQEWFANWFPQVTVPR